MPQVHRTSRAELDLLNIWEFIADDSLEAADRLIRNIHSRCQTLSESPLSGHKREDLAPNLRSCALGNYVIFYRPAADGIEVIRVLHGARDIPTIFAQEGI